MLNPMRVPIVLLTSLVLAFPYASVQAQRSTPDLITQAFQLSSGGQPKAAIAILEPMLQAGMNAEERDVEWPGMSWVGRTLTWKCTTRRSGRISGLSRDCERFQRRRLSMRHRLTVWERSITEAAAGRNTFAYATAEDAYAQILRASGAKEEAARLSKEATGTLADLELRLCNGCTINASGFR
jgi:hypothetical protein